MNTKFQEVDLNQLRYSIVWEGHHAINQALKINEEDHVLVITSAGDNVLNILLQNPEKVIAIDLNPIQNLLLEFKVQLIRHCSYEEYTGLMGLMGRNSVRESWSKIKSGISERLKDYWDTYFQNHPDGIMLSGKLESYIVSFAQNLPRHYRESLNKLLKCSSIREQEELFDHEINDDYFRRRFIEHFNRKNLGKGRDPKLYQHVKKPDTGAFFYRQLCGQSRISLWKNNFYFRFFFFGPLDLPQSILPLCYQKKEYDHLKNCMDRLQIYEGEIVDFLMSSKGRNVTKACMSNVFEYTSTGEFNEVITKLNQVDRNHPLKLIYWNLLQDQQFMNNNQVISNVLSDIPASCFYFRNAIQLQFNPINKS